ncbi:hypothetical protein B566_EDAN008126 [Ephemera danica]|nr:hypothetical protein B566_EDAN008126 [Ephemera danica]
MKSDESDNATDVLSILTTDHVSRKFGFLDYSVFCVLMLTSASIGTYFAFFAKQKQNTTKEYLMGGKTMGIFPITMSLVASYISGVSLLGVPAEIYTYGTQYGVIIIAEIFVCVVTAYMFMPVFYNLQLYSSFEYLRLRYDNSVRLLLSVLYCLLTILYTPLIIYIPALAFSQVTGINLHIVSPITCAICIFYTSLGGLKAVVWTDTLQSFAMILGVLLVAILGTIDVGGISVVLQRAADSKRLEFFNLDPNPLVRHTFWTVAIRKVDQILPFTVMDFSTTIPGFPGLFIAGVFSAALSSMSTMLNSMSGVILQDFIRPCLGTRKISEQTASNIMKVVVVIVGAFCVGLVFIVDKLGAIIQGALYGGIASLISAGWVALGSQAAIADGSLRFQTKTMSIDGCTYHHTGQ